MMKGKPEHLSSHLILGNTAQIINAFLFYCSVYVFASTLCKCVSMEYVSVDNNDTKLDDSMTITTEDRHSKIVTKTKKHPNRRAIMLL